MDDILNKIRVSKEKDLIVDYEKTVNRALDYLVSIEGADDQKIDQIRKRVLDMGGYLTVIKSPENLKSSSEIFTIDPIKFKISQNIKKSFDPKRIFTPGKMYTGI